MPVAVITGASRGLGEASAAELVRRAWTVVVDARTAADLGRTVEQLRRAGPGAVVGVVGSVAEPEHRQELVQRVQSLGLGLDLLVNNASLLGPSPQPRLADLPIDAFEHVYAVNVTAPLALTQLLLPQLRASSGRLVNITSDAAVEAYEGWGGYGSSKAALDQWTAILAAEEHDVFVYAFDPGDMRTVMHQQAFPGEDISDRPEPETVIPALLRLVTGRLASGRYQASRLLSDAGVEDQQIGGAA